jgi:hypothetical protein
MQWKVSIPLATSFVLFSVWTTLSIKEGSRLVSFIQSKNPQEILSNKLIAQNINSKPFFVGKSLMFYVVQKQNPELIDHFLEKGADPGRTLIYLSETRNFDLFRGYYPSLATNLSQDEYYLVLLQSANSNFTEGYRYLVNSEKFGLLHPDFKADLARNHKPTSKDRRPASSAKD